MAQMVVPGPSLVFFFVGMGNSGREDDERMGIARGGSHSDVGQKPGVAARPMSRS